MTLLTSLLAIVVGQAPDSSVNAALLTVAEKSEFKATARHVDVVKLCDELAKANPETIRTIELGVSGEGRRLPALVLAKPAVADADAARRSGKMVVMAIGNIHAGEVCGKEALPILAREMAAQPDHPAWKKLILVFAPIFNADGNERMSPSNRSGQVGPEQGMGIRYNAKGLDLNRDFVKLEAPETRALVRFLNKWDPAILVDCHTTNGSFHRYAITYDVPRNPLAGERLVAFSNERLAPEISRRFETISGKKTFYYGNFNREKTRWTMYGTEPRYSTQYMAARKRIGVLSEAYAYLPYKERIFATRDFVRAVVEYAAEHVDDIRGVIGPSLFADRAERGDTPVSAGQGRTGGRRRNRFQSNPEDLSKEPAAVGKAESKRVVIRTAMEKSAKRATILGFVEETKDGKRQPTDQSKEYEVEHWSIAKAVKTVEIPAAYVLEPKFNAAEETLKRHGIVVQELREDLEIPAEQYTVISVARPPQPFQGHRTATVKAECVASTQRLKAGTLIVDTSQALGELAAYLLEPESEDGLCYWNFFDESLAEGKPYPVLRLLKPAPMLTAGAKPLPEDQKPPKPIVFGMQTGFGGMRELSGNQVMSLEWLDDEHFVQAKQGKSWKVHAATGNATPFTRPATTSKLADSLAKLETISAATASGLAIRAVIDSQKIGAFVEYERDLYYGKLDGSFAVRLTRTPGQEELSRFSPDGKYVSFVRQGNLYVVDVATQTERALTTDGGDANQISNGKNDWVYFEEIFNRNWNAYWWSPDSTRLAFLRFDDSGVKPFTVVNHLQPRQTLETTAYPKAGDPNPQVSLAIVTAAGGEPKFVDLSDYSDFLIARVGWLPDSSKAFCYVLNRQQTWLDFHLCPTDGSSPSRLFRETTKAWVDDPGDPYFLKDGSFLLPLERTGWKHVYHFDKSGKQLSQVTDGEFEVRRVLRVDEDAGWIYFLSTEASHVAENLYRVKLSGGNRDRLTPEDGRHLCAFSPGGKYFLDAYSSHRFPGKSVLRSADGKMVRVIDSNPVHSLGDYKLGETSLVEIECKDGFKLHGIVVRPTDFDPNKKYPVWFMTYGGPHAPTISDSWSGGRANDHLLANLGIVVFRCDPRSASGKGAVSTWSCYRQMGVQELRDIEEAIDWLCGHSWVDSKRIGMSGHSYGGFMTAYALTHSRKFCAGIAGAPVTDWRNYDSIYTERYMDLPQNNPDGYAKTSVVRAARNLHGRLLLLHGAIDDNVHLQNTIQLAHALQAANKDFEMMVYPTARHGIFGPHYSRLMHEFILKSLKVEATKPAAELAGGE